MRRAHLARSFSAATEGYDAAAVVQAEAIARLLPGLPDRLAQPKIWELGVGTGGLSAGLIQRYPQAQLLGWDLAPGMIARCRARWPARRADFRIGDAERDPPPAGLGLIASSFALQWLSDPEAFFVRAARASAPGGALAVALPVAPTLPELAEAHLRATGRPLPGLSYLSVAQLERFAARAGWQLRALDAARHRSWHPSPRAALGALKQIGAHRADGGQAPPLGPTALRSLLKIYARDFGQAGQVPMSYQVCVLHARRP